MCLRSFLTTLSFGLLALTPAACDADAASKPVRIVIVGDSTVCDYPDDRPERGWGQFIEERFKKSAVTVSNLAAPGRSSKTFRSEGRWKEALEAKPNYILIQFGHNDSHGAAQSESTDAATDYKDYLRSYIEEARAVGATPILVTPMVRRSFGKQVELKDDLLPYANAMKEVAAEKKAAVIDLHASSLALVKKLGPFGSAAMANKAGDLTHFNKKGSRKMADLVMQELPAAEPRLKQYLKRR